MFVTFDDWTQGRAITSFGTNTGADELPFQTWRNFKEAYAPELIARAVGESVIPVKRCLDPFGGSGTTALACQFLGVYPTTIEVNPFLADLIEAKLTTYNADILAHDLGTIAGCISKDPGDIEVVFGHLPPTFIEPGVENRWIFDRAIAARVAAILSSIDELSDVKHRRLFRVLLGGILVDMSNVVISGKGRRYRRKWQEIYRSPNSVDEAFCDSARRAIGEIHRYSGREQTNFDLLRADSRTAVADAGKWDLAIFSPPYPNSFDYTDVYNVELWMLGYLKNAVSNRALRESTLSSHVQISRSFAAPPEGSAHLDVAMKRLNEVRASLWDQRIPEMVGAYFADLMQILGDVRASLSAGGSCWLVVGDSRYAGTQIATADIIAELASQNGWTVEGRESFRSMRLSPQQGGHSELAETLIVLSNHG